jgi:hypothetical protein
MSGDVLSRSDTSASFIDIPAPPLHATIVAQAFIRRERTVA